MMNFRKSNPWCLLVNFVWLYLAYGICRLAFFFEQRSLFDGTITLNSTIKVMLGGLMFDTSAICYTNFLWGLLILLPLKCKEKDWYVKACKWVFVIINGIALSINLADISYYSYTGRRTTSTFFKEFSNEQNLLKILGIDVLNHWYLLLLGVAMIFALYKLYRKPDAGGQKHYYVTQAASLLVFATLSIIGIRGGVKATSWPMSMVSANQFVQSPKQAGIVLNTPFTLIRTIGQEAFHNPEYFSEEELDKVYSPILELKGSAEFKHKNVLIILAEGLSEEYLKVGYAPFLDSLRNESLTWEQTYSNGRISVDAMPAVFCSIPCFVESFFLTSCANNTVNSLSEELARKSYYTAFLHGSDNSSLGIRSFVLSIGYKDYFGRTEYNADPRFDGDRDFDGTWAIWDHKFLQFSALKLKEFREPFLATIFTATDHHPFNIPKGEPGAMSDDEIPIAKCVRYTDRSFRTFFNSIKDEPWYGNTIFIITGDHTNQCSLPEFKTTLGRFRVPIIIYDPSGEIKAELRPGIAEHIDIMPTVLALLGYDGKLVSFGQNLLDTPTEELYSVSYVNDVYQYHKGDWVLLMDWEKTTALYNLKDDPMMQKNLVGNMEIQKKMERELRGIIQSYMTRMIANDLR